MCTPTLFYVFISNISKESLKKKKELALQIELKQIRIVRLLFYVLATPKMISGQVLTCDVCTHGDFIVLPIGRRPGFQHHDLISHSVILS